jgi:hypothetical protein
MNAAQLLLDLFCQNKVTNTVVLVKGQPDEQRRKADLPRTRNCQNPISDCQNHITDLLESQIRQLLSHDVIYRHFSVILHLLSDHSMRNENKDLKHEK